MLNSFNWDWNVGCYRGDLGFKMVDNFRLDFWSIAIGFALSQFLKDICDSTANVLFWFSLVYLIIFCTAIGFKIYEDFL